VTIILKLALSVSGSRHTDRFIFRPLGLRTGNFELCKHSNKVLQCVPFKYSWYSGNSICVQIKFVVCRWFEKICCFF